MFGASLMTQKRDGTIVVKLQMVKKKVYSVSKVLNTEVSKLKPDQVKHAKFGLLSLLINMTTLHQNN